MRHAMWRLSFETSKVLSSVSHSIRSRALSRRSGINLRLFAIGVWIGNISDTLTDRRIDKLLGGSKDNA